MEPVDRIGNTSLTSRFKANTRPVGLVVIVAHPSTNGRA
uniref:Uncharacterized protein n=1 Tax=Rhizobium leguminosarum bv. viciae TaxID=387 RepID=A0A0U2YUN7_RHILV|nr:hypothetical protein [Rhizobium leguminosarum bv. viciae]